VPSNLAAAWSPCVEEGLIGGVLQGRKQFDPRGASRMCKKRLWELAREVAALAACEDVERGLDSASYAEVKCGMVLGARRKVKQEVRDEALRGWVRNAGGEDFARD
jgi:tRNA-specific adenosine deaminase 1